MKREVSFFWCLICLIGVGNVLGIIEKGFCQTPSPASPPNELVMRFVGGGIGRPKEVLSGEPVMFILGMWNETAQKVKDAEERLKRIREDAERRKLSDAQMALLLSQPEAVEAIRAASVKVVPIDLGANWCRRVKFVVERVVGSGKQMKKIPVLVNLDWSRYLHEEEKRQQVLLETFRPQWYVDPEFTRKLEPGEYHLKAILGRWGSEPCALIVKSPRTDEEQARLYVALSNYHLERYRDFVRAAEYAKKAIALGEPRGAHHALAQVYEDQGKLQSALAEYEKELQVFYRKNPNAYELPQGLFAKIAQLRERLKK